MLRLLTLRLCIVQKGVFSLSKGTLDCFPWIVREIRVLDDELVQLISEIVRTCRPAMPIIDSEEGATWPVRGVLELGLNDIKDDGDTVFVIVPDNTLMSVRCIRGYYTVTLAGILCRLIGLYKLDNGWIQFILNSSRIIHEIVMKGCRRVHRPRSL